MTSMISRVVPGTSVTIAAGRRASALSSDDLPAATTQCVASGVGAVSCPARDQEENRHASRSGDWLTRVRRARDRDDDARAHGLAAHAACERVHERRAQPRDARAQRGADRVLVDVVGDLVVAEVDRGLGVREARGDLRGVSSETP